MGCEERHSLKCIWTIVGHPILGFEGLMAQEMHLRTWGQLKMGCDVVPQPKMDFDNIGTPNIGV